MFNNTYPFLAHFIPVIPLLVRWQALVNGTGNFSGDGFAYVLIAAPLNVQR